MPSYHQSPADGALAISNHVTARLLNNGNVTGTAVDTQGYDGCLFVLNLGTIDATVDMAISRCATAGFSTVTAITGASIAQVSATGDGFIVAVDVWRPSQRYLRASITIGNGTTGAQLACAAHLYRKAGMMPMATQTLNQLVKVAEN